MAKTQIIMPSFNRPKLLKRAVKTVLAQTCQDWKLYVMDNSSPETYPLVQETLKEFENEPRIIVDHTSVANADRYKFWWVAKVCNKALFEFNEKEPYVILTSDDVIMMPQKIELLSNYLDAHPDIVFIHGICELLADDSSVRHYYGGADTISPANHVDWVQPMWRRTVLDRIGRLPEIFTKKSVDLFLFEMVSGNLCVGINKVLDKQYLYSYNTRHKPEMVARANSGKTMEPDNI